MDIESLSILQKQNIWWEGRMEDDSHLRQWHEHEKRWIPFQIDEFVLKPYSFNMLIGPRQAGKTTLIKFVVKKLIEEKTDPRSVLYLRCDELSSSQELRLILENFFSYARSKKVFIFLDEITEVDGWEKTLKGFIDDGDFREAVVTVSGSNAFQLQKGSELFPGRRGHGITLFILPLSFREFVHVVDPELIKKIPPLEDILDFSQYSNLLQFQNRLHVYLLDYLICGGFPLSVLSFLKEHIVLESARETYRSWVIGDILKNGKSDAIAREIIKVILSKVPSPVSWEAISQETSIKSPPTVSSYVELFERLFILLPLYAVNPNSRTKEFAKNKKLHLFDPLLWHLFEEWCLQSVKNKTEAMVEAVLAVHVARFLLKKNQGRRFNDYVSYWKNGSEVDVVAYINGELAGFEMKWTDHKKEFCQKVLPIKPFIYVSKTTFRQDPPPIIPLALFLARL